MSHISTPQLHQLRLGELSPSEEGRLRQHLADCPRCSDRLDAQQQLRQEFQRQPLPAWVQPAQPWWLRWKLPLLSLVPVLAAILLMIRPPVAPVDPVIEPEASSTDPGLHQKGLESLLEAWIQTGSTARPLYLGESVSAGSRIQLKFNPGQHRFATLAGKDSTGLVEIYGTVPARGPGLQAAPFSLTLDDTRGQQLFYAILTDSRPDVDLLRKSIQNDPIRLDHAELVSVVVKKE